MASGGPELSQELHALSRVTASRSPVSQKGRGRISGIREEEECEDDQVEQQQLLQEREGGEEESECLRERLREEERERREGRERERVHV